jgi:hypothetical protein
MNPLDIKPSQPISAETAVALAEEFIRRNGYTLAPADPSGGMAPESFELVAKSEKRVKVEHVDIFLDAAEERLPPG